MLQDFRRSLRNIRFAIGAAVQAVRDSGLEEGLKNPERFGVYLGAGEGQQDFLLFMSIIAEAQRDGDFDMERFTRLGLERMNPKAEIEQEPKPGDPVHSH